MASFLELQRIAEHEEQGPLQQIQAEDLNGEDGQPPTKRQKAVHHCSDCDSWFTEMRALSRHRRTSRHLRTVGLELKDRFACAFCKEIFTRDYDRRRHVNRKHAYVSVLTEPTQIFESYASPTARFPGMGTRDPVTNGETESTLESHQIDDLVFFDVGEKNARDSVVDSDASQFIPHRIDELSSGPNSNSTETSINEADEWVVIPTATSQYGQQNEIAKWPKYEQLKTQTAAQCRAKISVIQSQGEGKTIPTCTPYFCARCNRAFEWRETDLSIHLRRHLDEFFKVDGGHLCTVCNVTFTHQADLEMHNQLALKGHCGFNFPHFKPCGGHHPPNAFDIDHSDWDRFRYGVMLQHWEQAQLKAFRTRVDTAVRACEDPPAQYTAGESRRNARPPSVVYSVENCTRGSRRPTKFSLSNNIKTFASAPCDVPKSGETDVRGLQQRLQKMSMTWEIARRAIRGVHIPSK